MCGSGETRARFQTPLRSYVFAHLGDQRLALRLDTLLASTEETLLERGVALLHRRTPLGVVDEPFHIDLWH